MKTKLENADFDTRLEPSDWRYSAAIVGLCRYFRWLSLKPGCCRNDLVRIEDDYIEYNAETVCGKDAEQHYLEFVEDYFAEYMHHVKIEELLKIDNLSDDYIKLCNEKLTGNSICKKVFGKLKYSVENKDAIKRQIHDNRYDLIRETYRHSKSLYAKFTNVNCLLQSDDKGVCRLAGYYVDPGRKSKTIAYGFDKNTYVYSDEPEFDFIPFAFSKTREGIFINNNVTIEQLLAANDSLQQELDETEHGVARRCLFMPAETSSSFIKYSVEVIKKNQDSEYFETMFIREEAIKIFEAIGNRYKFFVYPCRVEKCGLDIGGYIPLEKIVTDSIINNLHLDRLIEVLLKDQNKGKHNRFVDLLSVLIIVNTMIYNGGIKMDNKLNEAIISGGKVVAKFKHDNAENKMNSYKEKLITALIFHNYDRFIEILMQLSSYSGIPFSFMYDLNRDFEGNKNLAYDFITRLNGAYMPITEDANIANKEEN